MNIKPSLILLILIFTASAGFSQEADTNKSISTSSTTNYLGQFYETTNSAQTTNLGNQPNPFWTFVKVILYIGVFAAAAYFLIRYLAKKGGLPATADETLVETLMTKFIGMGCYLQIVKVGATYYLLSLSGEGARLVDKITDKETIDFLEMNKDNMKPKQTKFFDILTFFPKGMNLDRFDFLKNQKDRLRKL